MIDLDEIGESIQRIIEGPNRRYNPTDAEYADSLADDGKADRPRGAPADPFANAVSFADLDRQTFRPPAYLVDKTVPLGGITLCSGAPKIGKSYLALGIGLAVAQGGPALGALTVEKPGSVLVISLDDTSHARAQERARAINRGRPLPANMLLHTRPNLGRGEDAQRALASYLGAHPDTRLVVIDTLEHLRGDRRPTESAYTADVRFMATLRVLLPANPDTSFLCLAHIRKERADDALQAVSGTYGVTGGADAVIVITGHRHAPGRAVEIINRDDEGAEYALRFTSHGLIYTDDDPHDPALFMSADDARVYRTLRDFGDGGATAVELSGVLAGIKNIGNRLSRLVQHNAARRSSRGRYVAL
jgi:AAA domain